MKIEIAAYEQMVGHAIIEAPVEACGYLGECLGVFSHHYPMTNVDGSGDHFSFDPVEQLSVIKQMREDGIRPGVVYHSHPETPARPSAEDLRLAVDPEVIHVIVSLSGERPEVKAFRIIKGDVSFEPIERVR